MTPAHRTAELLLAARARQLLKRRKQALLADEHYSASPLSKAHRDDIHRWLHDLDLAIDALNPKVKKGKNPTSE